MRSTQSNLGADTEMINGQLVSTPQMTQYSPQGWGPQTLGVPNVTPAFPPFLGGATPTSMAPGAESVGGYGTAGNNNQVTQMANAHPWNWRVSPVPWAIGGLLLALFLLKAIHWNDALLEGKAGLDLGPTHASAEAGA